jgi:hypothetical protein
MQGWRKETPSIFCVFVLLLASLAFFLSFFCCPPF